MRQTGGKINSKDFGNVGEVEAITYYTKKGYKVSKPLFENCKYDIIIDMDGKLKRVQVKTSRSKTPSGKYIVNFRTCGGNRSGKDKVTWISEDFVDIVFIYLEDGSIFELPVEDVAGRTTLTL